MDHVEHVPRVRAETFGALLVGYDFQESEVVHGGRLPPHFQTVVKTVVLLVGIAVACLDPALAQFQGVAAFLADLRNGDNAELQSMAARIVFYDGFAEP